MVGNCGSKLSLRRLTVVIGPAMVIGPSKRLPAVARVMVLPPVRVKLLVGTRGAGAPTPAPIRSTIVVPAAWVMLPALVMFSTPSPSVQLPRLKAALLL